MEKQVKRLETIEEFTPKSARDWLEVGLGMYQITHIHSAIRKAMELMDVTEPAGSPVTEVEGEK